MYNTIITLIMLSIITYIIMNPSKEKFFGCPYGCSGCRGLNRLCNMGDLEACKLISKINENI